MEDLDSVLSLVVKHSIQCLPLTQESILAINALDRTSSQFSQVVSLWRDVDL